MSTRPAGRRAIVIVIPREDLWRHLLRPVTADGNPIPQPPAAGAASIAVINAPAAATADVSVGDPTCTAVSTAATAASATASAFTCGLRLRLEDGHADGIGQGRVLLLVDRPTGSVFEAAPAV